MKSLHLFEKKQTTTFSGFQIFEYALYLKNPENLEMPEINR